MRFFGFAIVSVGIVVSVLALNPGDTAQQNNSNIVVSITFPPERHLFKDGTNADLVRSKCQVCHSSDYIYTQPPLTKAQWTTEVNKMRGAYGATFILDGDVDKIVDYLVTQNGKP